MVILAPTFSLMEHNRFNTKWASLFVNISIRLQLEAIGRERKIQLSKERPTRALS